MILVPRKKLTNLGGAEVVIGAKEVEVVVILITRLIQKLITLRIHTN